MKLLSLVLIAAACSCTPAQVATVKSVDATAINLTNAVCALAPDSPVGQPYVEIVCAVAEGVEQTVAVVVGQLPTTGAAPDSGAAPTTGTTTTTMSVPVTQIRFRMPAANAREFLAAHAKRR